ncbi:SUMO-activating enzyme subunit 1 [Neodiprion fabricii]|uniref:SUMO-activating enzyme subunit 1 n=1 Tax=Neodiprion fabricii TaxID=2872261 RepID=UPI001ED90522|nr:SUMO-activating enzyme subunit 1 [Neodiprion fabricii]XP_046427974.1 SUMO-activating enzyme subunit 1 [Neodiprion fabricii]
MMTEEMDGNIIELTDAEAELYDRQIRLWGLESQKRLRAAKILLIGLNGFGAEVAKNIILAGVKSITFLDNRELSQLDLCAQFLAPKNAIGKNRAEASLERAQTLNPMVEVAVDTESVDDKPDKFFENFDVVCASECSLTQLKRINRACRKNGVKFFAGDVWGTFGYTFADLGKHDFVEDVVQSKKIQSSEAGEPALAKVKFETITTTVKKSITFVPFEKILDACDLPRDGEPYYLLQILLNYREKHGHDPLPSERDTDSLKKEAAVIIDKYKLGDKIDHLICENLYAQISPVCAIVGGVMAQEIIKTVSQKQSPHNNLFLFNPDTMCGKILCLGQK